MKSITYRKPWAVGAIAISVALASGCIHDDDKKDPMVEEQPTTPLPPAATMAIYQVTVLNLTYAQPFTPVAAVLHRTGYAAWTLGGSASVGLEDLAESGDTTRFIAEATANANVAATAMSSGGPFAPGASKTVMLSAAYASDLRLSVASMLANTNDAVAGFSGRPIGTLAVGESLTVMAFAHDAGTEQNTEADGTMPGPADGGVGYNVSRSGDVNYVHIHPGVVTMNDGYADSVLLESHRWQGPVTQVVVTRTQ